MRKPERDEVWFWQIGTEVHRLNDEVLRGLNATTGASRRSWSPNADLVELDGEFEITVELAGVNPDDIVLTYSPEHQAIVIRGRRTGESCEQNRQHYQLEIMYGEFERAVQLPDSDIDRNNIRAKFSAGMLVIQVPKGVAPPPTRNVKVAEE